MRFDDLHSKLRGSCFDHLGGGETYRPHAGARLTVKARGARGGGDGVGDDDGGEGGDGQGGNDAL